MIEVSFGHIGPGELLCPKATQRHSLSGFQFLARDDDHGHDDGTEFVYGIDAHGIHRFDISGVAALAVTSDKPQVATITADGMRITVTPRSVGTCALTIDITAQGKPAALTQRVDVAKHDGELACTFHEPNTAPEAVAAAG